MFHLFLGKLEIIGKKKFLRNELFGIEVQYQGKKKDGEFFLYPYLDENKKSVFYFAFESLAQKEVFEDLLKISGIGPKTAFLIAQMPGEELSEAIKTMDVKFFQKIPGIGPKSAKKILLELKDTIDFGEVEKLDMDQKLFKDIVKSLKNFGYDTDTLKKTLNQYEGKISKENMGEVIKRVIGKM